MIEKNYIILELTNINCISLKNSEVLHPGN